MKVQLGEVDGKRFGNWMPQPIEVLPGYHTVKIRWERFQWIEHGPVEKVFSAMGAAGSEMFGLPGGGSLDGYWKRKDDGELTVSLRAEAGRLYIVEITDFTTTPPLIGFRSMPRSPPRGSEPE